ncbi:glycosyltransferase [Thiohalorhabdus methylotrophus]|uniref:Glycosyltransferase n=1 Tax=Thiohalorhabdus methylotrophus TaxID=3242694 RepID=A0ABV4TVF2_9GAMM
MNTSPFPHPTSFKWASETTHTEKSPDPAPELEKEREAGNHCLIPENWENAELPLVSVIIPTYNAEPFISEALDSVLEQDYPNKEIIVVDDGSTDNTEDILLLYKDNIIIEKKENGGISSARNKGLEIATGEYIAFLDADDIWLPGKLTSQVTYLESNPHIHLIYGKVEEWRTNNPNPPIKQESLHFLNKAEPPSIDPDYSGWLYGQLLGDFSISTICVMLRSSLIESIGYFKENLEQGEDFEFWLRISLISEIHMLDQTMALFRKTGKNTTSECPDKNYAADIIEESIKKWGITNPDGSRANTKRIKRNLSQLWFLYGWKNKNAKRYYVSFISFLKSSCYDPSKPKTWIFIFLTGYKNILENIRYALRATRPVRDITRRKSIKNKTFNVQGRVQ